MAEQPPALIPQPPPVAYPARQTDSLAIAAFVVGLIAPLSAILLVGIPGVVLGAVALFLGLRSRSKIRRSGGALGGGGLALAGWILGICGIAVGLVIFLFFFSLFMAMQSGTNGKGSG